MNGDRDPQTTGGTAKAAAAGAEARPVLRPAAHKPGGAAAPAPRPEAETRPALTMKFGDIVLELPPFLGGVITQEDLDKLPEGPTRNTLEALAGTGGTLTAADLQQLHKELLAEAKAAAKAGKTDPQSTTVLEALRQEFERLKSAATASPADSGIAQVAQLLQEQLGVSKEQLRRTAVGYDALVGAEREQFVVDIDKLQQEVWFATLPEVWQAVVRQGAFWTNAANVKRVKGPSDLDSLTALSTRVETTPLNEMWQRMPGFRQAMTTMIADLFTIVDYIPPHQEDMIREAGKPFPQSVRLLQLTERGAYILNHFDQYRGLMVSALAEHISADPRVKKEMDNLPEALKGDAKIHAQAAFSRAWNLIFVANAPDSADFGRLLCRPVVGYPAPNLQGDRPDVAQGRGERTLRNGIVFAESMRGLASPGMRARAKFIRGEKELATDEGYLGKIGDYVAERARDLESGVRAGLENRTESLVPERLMASLFDLTTIQYQDTARRDVSTSLAEILVTIGTDPETKTGIARSAIVDDWDKGVKKSKELRVVVREPKRMPPWRRLASDLWIDYSDALDSAGKLYGAISGVVDPAKDPQFTDKLGTALNRLRKTVLAPCVNSTDTIIQLMAGVYGLTHGTDRMILNIDGSQYDDECWRFLQEEKWWGPLKPDSREKIIKTLMVADPQNFVANTTAWLLRTTSALLQERERIRSQAIRKWGGVPRTIRGGRR